MRAIAVAALAGTAAAAPAVGLGEECQRYLSAKGFSSADDLRNSLTTATAPAPCTMNNTAQRLYAPNPNPSIPGATDTTNLACRYGNPQMWGHCSTCCGIRPHFNWILGTCEETQGPGQFCKNAPKCLIDGSPKINYVATYQFDGNEFVLMDDSSVGDISADGISGNYLAGTGWKKSKDRFRWRGGDWTTKYAPWANGVDGVEGPRGITPPAGMWVLSAENFYYGAFYMLSQLGINLEGKHLPTGTNCWNWELDPVEGTAGWSPDNPLPGNLNMLYDTDSAQASGCMPVAYSSTQVNGFRQQFKFPEDFQEFCAANPTATGCKPWDESISWSGGSLGTHRFENFWDEPYVFAVVVDAKGFWTYRWRPTAYSESKSKQTTELKVNSTVGRDPSCTSADNPGCNSLSGMCCPAPDGMMLACCNSPSPAPAPTPAPGGDGKTGWQGLERHRAARTLPARPAPVRDPRGLKTDVKGDVAEAVILLPSLTTEATCLRASIEQVNWQFGSNALGAIAHQTGQDVPGGRYEGAQNWWTHFVDTKQNAGYPLSIAGVELSDATEALTCNTVDTFSCSCATTIREAVLGTRGPAGPAEEEEIIV